MQGVMMAPESELPAAPFWWPGTRAQWQVARFCIVSASLAYRNAQTTLYNAELDYDEEFPRQYTSWGTYAGRRFPTGTTVDQLEWHERRIRDAKEAEKKARELVERIGRRWGVTLRAG